MGIKDQFQDKAQELSERAKRPMGNPKDKASERASQPKGRPQQPQERKDEAQDRFEADYDA
ncbi:hypothetical protein ACIRTB_25320 [Streptomyces sp. NPDC101158]|uniref:hypothetical protein n=1 Tax=Streptomyces sp. NPDC101158 TaxID=3366117 RepID=UPI00382E97D9